MTDGPRSLPSFPASPVQARLARHPARHGVWAVVDVDGSLDVPRLEDALHDVASRHEILRTEVREEEPEGAWRQVVHERPCVEVRVEGSPRSAEELLDGAGSGASDPSAPVRVTVAAPEGGRTSLLVEASGLCLDGPGLGLLVEELARTYRGDPPAADGDLLQFADVAEWEVELAESEEGEPGRSYWRSARWPDAVATRLPFEREVGADDDASRWLERRLDDETGARITELARSLDVTTEVVFLTAYFSLLWRYARRTAVALDARSDGRGYEPLAEGIGPYARDLPIHVPIEGDTTFAELAERVAAELTAGRGWEQVFDWSLVAPTLGSAVGGETLAFGFEHGAEPHPVDAGGVSFRVGRWGGGRGDHRLHLAVWEGGEETRLRWSYASGAIAAPYVEGIARAFEAVLEGAAAASGTRVAELPLLDDEERRRLVEEPNDTERPYPTDRLIHDFIEDHAREHPDRPAVEVEGAVLTYGELDRRANQLAHHLRANGVGAGSLVAILAERSFEMIVAVLGVLKAGGGYVPLSPTYPPERLAFIMEQIAAPVVVVTVSVADLLPETDASVVRLEDTWSPPVANEPEEAPERTATPDDVAYVIYTSGSTGQPKGVVVTHRTFVISNEARNEYYGGGTGRFLLLSPFAFDSSIVGIFWTLTGGGTLCMIPEEEQRDVETLCRIIETRGITHTLTLPSFYDVILSHGDPAALASLETVVVAGEACPLTMVERHRTVLPDTGLYSEYGATETTIWSSAYDCLEQTIDTAPLGRPIANCEMYVLDDDLQPLPVGVPGEVHFGGAILARGYWNRPDLTAERFVKSPFREAGDARMYRSGDLARILPGGDMEFLGRVDNQVKIRGFRVELEEIEVALGAHPELAEVAVAARSASEWDPEANDDPRAGSKRLVGYVVARSEACPDAAGLRGYLAERVPSYMVPAAFVTLDRLPRTPNGKLDRDALPAIDPTKLEQSEPTGEAPTSPAEVALAEIWKRVLGVGDVGRDDNFFELGGDSILSIQVVALARKQGLQISARDVFEQQTVARLAAADGSGEVIDATQGPVTGPVPLHPIQRWFVEQERPEPHHANMAVVLLCGEALELEPLRQAVEALRHHHDALRTRFSRTEKGWSQEIPAEPRGEPVRRIDVSELSPDERREAIEAEVCKAQRDLRLEEGDLLRVLYFDCGGEEPPRLALVAHHLVFDGVSLRILLEDLEDAYDDLRKGRAPRLPLKTTSYTRWNEALVARAREPELLAELDFWRGLASAEAVELPVDPVAGPGSNTFADQAVVVRSLSRELTGRLLREVRAAHGSRIDEVLLTALAGAVCEWTGGPGLYVELEGHGREPFAPRLDATRTIGWFTTAYPAYLTIEGENDLHADLTGVMEALRATPSKGAGFGILRYLGDDDVRSELAALPRRQVNFNYMGRFDGAMGVESLFRPAPESAGPDFSPAAERPHELEVVATVVDDEMTVEWMYSRGLHSEDTVQRLARSFEERLVELVDACVGTEETVPDDFDDFAWDASDLSEITTAVERSRRGD